jgi:type VI secretion system protein ImpH
VSESTADLHPLARRLVAEGDQFALFQAIGLLQAFNPDAPAIGHQGPPGREAVSLGGVLDMTFPTSDLTELERTGVDRFQLRTSVLGLYGVDSPLPLAYTEDLLHEEEPEREQAFYDIFQHRLLSLLYRAWLRPRYGVRFQMGGSDQMSGWLRRLAHIEGSPKGQHLLGFAGLLTQEPRSAATLLAVARTSFPDVEIDLEPFLERWVPLADDQQVRLGVTDARLGQTAVLGSRIRDRAGSFLLRLRTRAVETYRKYLPDGERLALLADLVRLFNTDMLDMVVELRLIPEVRTQSALGAEATRLGWSAWLGNAAPQARRVRFVFQGVL